MNTTDNTDSQESSDDIYTRLQPKSSYKLIAMTPEKYEQLIADNAALSKELAELKALLRFDDVTPKFRSTECGSQYQIEDDKHVWGLAYGDEACQKFISALNDHDFLRKKYFEYTTYREQAEKIADAYSEAKLYFDELQLTSLQEIQRLNHELEQVKKDNEELNKTALEEHDNWDKVREYIENHNEPLGGEWIPSLVLRWLKQRDALIAKHSKQP